MKIAIHPDEYPAFGDEKESSSELWHSLAKKAGIETKVVNVYEQNIIEQLRGCDGFMWRASHQTQHRQIATRVFPLIHHAMNIPTYPDHQTFWHYDDKISEALLLKAFNLPQPDFKIFWDKKSAYSFFKSNSHYPIVAKLYAGAGATNVCLIKNRLEGEQISDRIFGTGIRSLALKKSKSARELLTRVRDSIRYLSSGDHPRAGHNWQLHKDYLFLQEFMPNNDFDTRITVIGNRAFGFRRKNRENDFRASGSGNIDYDSKKIGLDFVKLAFDVSRKLNLQSVAIDGIRSKAGKPVTVEISYTYMSTAVYNCPGHWVIEKDNGHQSNWVEGKMWPEEAQFEDFIQRVKQA